MGSIQKLLWRNLYKIDNLLLLPWLLLVLQVTYIVNYTTFKRIIILIKEYIDAYKDRKIKTFRETYLALIYWTYTLFTTQGDIYFLLYKICRLIQTV